MKRSRLKLGECVIAGLLALLAAAAGAAVRSETQSGLTEPRKEQARRLVEEYLEGEGLGASGERGYRVEELVLEGERVVALLTPASGVGEALVFGFRIEPGEIEELWRLVGRLITGEEGSAPSLPVGAPPLASEAGEPDPMPADQVPVEPAAPEPAPLEAPPTAAQAPAATTPGALEGTVLVAAKGQPREFLIQATDAMAAHLREAGVKLEFATHGVGYMQDPLAGMPMFLEQVRESGAAGLLFLTARFGSREFIELECHDGAGGKLWKERVQGGLGLAKVQMNANLLKRLLKKVDKRHGGPCLPGSG